MLHADDGKRADIRAGSQAYGAGSSEAEAGDAPQVSRAGAGWPFFRLALQNLARRKTRTLLLVLAVAVGSAAVFTTAGLTAGIVRSMEVGFARLGADLLIVPQGTLVNISAALLTAEPAERTLDAALAQKVAALGGVRQVAPQRIFRREDSGYQPHGAVDLIGFDPARDFTVMPWLAERLERPLQRGDVILGARRNEPLGSEIQFYGLPLSVYGRLSPTGVGTHEHGFFMTFETLGMVAQASRKKFGAIPLDDDPARISALLIKLLPDATAARVRFAVLANVPGTKAVSGGSLLTSVRQGLSALLGGILVLMTTMLLAMALLIGVLFSALIAERRQELGLLKAVGATKGQIVRMILAESALATGCGGACGVLLAVLAMRLYRHSLVYYIDALGIPFVWLSAGALSALALGCLLLAAGVGLFGAWFPAWRAGRQEPFDLIRVDV